MFSLTEDRQIIVLDLEWNQSSYNPNHRMPHEIIEIGACRVDEQYRVVDTFSRIIRPTLYKRLDKHIRDVTGITEQELSGGGRFEDVFAEFVSWCGECRQLVTWGRDDYPVLRRNAAFFGTPMPFAPPLDAQLVFGFSKLGGAHQQMNLHAALELMELAPDVPAHRAVYDAQCTAALLCATDEAVRALAPEKHEELARILSRESRVASSALRSRPTPYAYQSDALCDQELMALCCPECGKPGAFDTKWFDTGRDKYYALAVCPKHGTIFGQMHFKRATSGTLILHMRAYMADEGEIADVHERYRLFCQIPPAKRHHRLSMDDAQQRKTMGRKEYKPS